MSKENGVIMKVENENCNTVIETISMAVVALIEEEGLHPNMNFSVKYNGETVNIDMKY